MIYHIISFLDFTVPWMLKSTFTVYFKENLGGKKNMCALYGIWSQKLTIQLYTIIFVFLIVVYIETLYILFLNPQNNLES